MAETTLRAYVAEIEELIDQSQLDEAVAHCRQILTYYPKHLDTYRLLGKALLEQGRHGDAADIFQRVLSAVPDDFVSQVGMSIVREDEANLDAAIFHMERAFEVNPANPAIQEELKRLFGRRDGMEPPRVRLSRGALARMYARGHHFDQAVAELRAALGEDPDRPDLRLVLAEVYWLAEQRADAAETCTAILDTLPHCKLANRIMADLWAASGRQHEAQVYRSRLEALDPYEAFADHANGVGPENVTAGQVRVQKLDWNGPASVQGGESPQPNWVSSLGVTLEEPKPAGAELPDWLMETPGTPSDAPASGPDLPPAEPGTPPEWLIASAPAGVAASMKAQDEEPAVAGDLFSDAPDWLKDQLSPSDGSPLPSQPASAPPAAEASPAVSQTPEAGLPEWLAAPSDTQPAAPADVPDWLRFPGPDAEASTPAPSADAIPDWMRAPEPDSSPDPALAPPQSELPEWMRPREAQGPAAPSAPAEGSELPEWMRAPEALSEAQPSTPESGSDTPDWLNSISPTDDATLTFQSPEWLRAIPPASKPPEPESGPNLEPSPSSPVSGADDLPNWMRDAAAPAGAASPFDTLPPAPGPAALAPLTESPSQPPDDQASIPDWLEQAGWGPSTPEAVKESEQRAHDEWQVDAEPEATVALPAEDIPDWLRAMAPPELRSPAEGSAESAPAAPPDQQAPAVPSGDADRPEWLMGLDAESPAPTAPEDDSMKPPVWLRTPLEASEPPSAPNDESLPSWLRDPLEASAEQSAAKPPAPRADAEASESLPDWLKNVIEEEDGAELSMDAGQGKPFVGQTGPLDNAPLISSALSEKPPEEPEVWVAPEEAQPSPPAPLPEARETALTPDPASVTAISPAVAGPIDEEGPAPESVPLAELPAPESVAAPATEPTGSAVEEMSDDDALAWLESLAARQGVDSSELITRPEDRPVETPRWIEDLVSENAPVPEEAGPSTQVVQPHPPAIPVEPPREETAASPVPELPDWLKAELEAQDLMSEAVAPATVPESVPSEAGPEPVDQPPALEEVKPEPMPFPEPAVVSQPQWGPAPGERIGTTEEPAPAPEAAPEPEASLDFTPGPLEAAQPIETAPTEEPLPAVEPVTAPVAETPEDASDRAPGPEAPVVEEKRHSAPAPRPRRSKAAAPALPREELLSSARRNVMAGSFEEGLEAYGRLIRTGSCLSEVIADLENTLAAHPADPVVLQLLGDAYMADNQLQRALDTYRLALDRI